MKPAPTAPPRFAVGIDLGTTNSALAYADLEGDGGIEDFRILQVVAPGETARLDTLPSFHYEAAAGEAGRGAFDLPWTAGPATSAVGAGARDLGALAPGRLVASAKSWLCHAGVERRGRILPWHGAEDVARLSPVEATARYLDHLRQAWNHEHPEHPLEGQDVVVTIPASFDEVARELTAEAVALAGLARVTLLEEPQAAFYAWIAAHAQDEAAQIRPGRRVLVCDIGGGTTDFSLMETGAGADGRATFRRVAVGDHLILGGDNLDLALAHHLEPRLDGGRPLDARRWSMWVRRCGRAKEELLGPGAPASRVLSLPAGGSRLVGGSLQAEVSREEAVRVLVDGFLPMVPPDAEPARTGSGFREFGLPYAADPAITRHLAAFLKRQGGKAPEAVLLNGGFFESPALRTRLQEVLASWYGAGAAPELFGNDRLDLAVARGAAYYGRVRRGQGVRIDAGLPRAYYVGVADATGAISAVCVAPAGLEEGAGVETPGHVFSLLLRQPVEFPVYTSAVRPGDAPGDVVAPEQSGLEPMPPMRTVLKTGRNAVRTSVEVGLFCRVTEIGTLEVGCREKGGGRQWPLQFDLRARPEGDGGTGAVPEATLEEGEVTACGKVVREAFAGGAEALSRLPRDLEEAAGLPRADWPPLLLRRLWEALADARAARGRSAEHEARWLNLAGFVLRPGFGVVLDDWRVDEIWKQMPQGVMHARNELCRAEWWILWRRIAGGLNEGRQAALADPLVAAVKGGAGTFACGGHEAAERWRLLGCLERLPAGTRRALGDRLAARVARKGWGVDAGAAAWALARLGAREPLYGPLHGVVDAESAAGWIDPLLALDAPGEEHLLGVALVARRTGDRYRDFEDATRARVLAWLRRHGAGAHVVALVEEGGELDAGEQAAASGESLPAGLRWVHS